MRLGGEIKQGYTDPEDWMRKVKDMRYSAAYAPVDSSAPADVIAAYKKQAELADLVMGEVGVWRNVLDTDDLRRAANMEYAKKQLALAEELNACCCVNIAGSRSEIWDGFDADNYSEDTYTLIVDSVREIIDAVKPKRTVYSLEPMPWMVPDSPEEYLKLIKDIDRKEFGVHLDFVNMISCPKRYVLSDAFIKECFDKLGPYIKSIHGKDVIMDNAYTTLIHEVMPGRGTLDYVKLLPYVEKLGPDTPFFAEHLPDEASYREATGYIRKCAEKAGIRIKETK